MLEKTTGVEKNNSLGGSEVEKRKEQAGQAMVEYAILLLFISMAVFGVIGVFVSGLGSFYLNLVKVITLPFP